MDLDADTEVTQDIARFIDAKLNYVFSLKKYPQPTRVKVKDIFRQRAQGTFLWIGIAAKTLERYSAIEFEKALERLPPGLDDLYDRILLGIRVDHRQIAARILRWVVMAVRPLTLSELGAIIEPTIEPPTGFTREDMTKEQISYCGYFLTVEACEVNLIHQSAKDYLLRRDRDSTPELKEFRVEVKVGNYEIATNCLQYLEDNLLASKGFALIKDLLKVFPLLSYATCFWHIHARSLSRSDDIFDLSRPFYRKNSRIRRLWLYEYHHFTYNWDFGSSKLLHIASYFDILPLAEKVLTQEGSMNKAARFNSLNQKDDEEMTALHWAAHLGHLAIVRLLLEKGADVNRKGMHGITALGSAATHGYEGIVRLLLERGADVNGKGIHGRVALGSAAMYGYEGVVRLLLEREVDVNAKGDDGITALYMAAKFGHEEIVRLLLDRGADANTKGKNGKVALKGAAWSGYERVVRLLLDRGADVNAKTNDGTTALDYASVKGRKGVVRLLLERGADVDTKNEDGMTALDIASVQGHKGVVKLLTQDRWCK